MAGEISLDQVLEQILLVKISFKDCAWLFVLLVPNYGLLGRSNDWIRERETKKVL